MFVLKWIQERYGNIKPVVIDGALYVVVAICAFLESELKNDNAYKYFNPYVLYFSALLIGTIGAGALALKMFRDKSYSNHLEAKKTAEDLQNGNTTILKTEDVTVQQTTTTKQPAAPTLSNSQTGQ